MEKLKGLVPRLKPRLGVKPTKVEKIKTKVIYRKLKHKKTIEDNND